MGNDKAQDGFPAEERAAMKERAAELTVKRLTALVTKAVS